MDREQAIDLALKTYAAQGETRTLSVEYRGNLRSFEVVTLNPEVPFFNPNNSRLRAQLASHPNQVDIKTNPKSISSQQSIQSLLAKTEKFEDLKQQLVDYGQQEPGLVSRAGLLVNGNTRLAAIRALGWTGVDVAVLPEDATDEDFFAIEMTLQLRNLVHQGYTFTNRLLLVDNHLQRTKNEDATILAMQWKRDGKRMLREHQGRLALVEEIRALNPALSYSFFDTKEEAIKNLYSQYSAMQAIDVAAAERMKYTRIAALLLGLNKDEVREIDETFLEEELLPAIDGNENLETFFGSFTEASPSQSALSQIVGGSSTTKVSINLLKLTQDIASKVVDADGLVPDEKIETHFKKLHDVVRDRARNIREERIASDLRREPIEYLKDVTQRIQKLADEIPVLFRDAEFNTGAFEYQAKKTEKAIQALQDALTRKLE